MKTTMNMVKININFTSTELHFQYLEKPLQGEKFTRDTAKVYSEKYYTLAELPTSLFIDCPASRHGLKQKLADNLAYKADEKEGISVEDASGSTDDLWKQLVSGNWNAKRKDASEIIKVNKSKANEALENMSEEDKLKSLALMKQLGISL